MDLVGQWRRVQFILVLNVGAATLTRTIGTCLLQAGTRKDNSRQFIENPPCEEDEWGQKRIVGPTVIPKIVPRIGGSSEGAGYDRWQPVGPTIMSGPTIIPKIVERLGDDTGPTVTTVPDIVNASSSVDHDVPGTIEPEIVNLTTSKEPNATSHGIEPEIVPSTSSKPVDAEASSAKKDKHDTSGDSKKNGTTDKHDTSALKKNGTKDKHDTGGDSTKNGTKDKHDTSSNSTKNETRDKHDTSGDSKKNGTKGKHGTSGESKKHGTTLTSTLASITVTTTTATVPSKSDSGNSSQATANSTSLATTTMALPAASAQSASNASTSTTSAPTKALLDKQAIKASAFAETVASNGPRLVPEVDVTQTRTGVGVAGRQSLPKMVFVEHVRTRQRRK